MATKNENQRNGVPLPAVKKQSSGSRQGLGTLFGGLLLIVLAFVRGDSVWRVLHDAAWPVWLRQFCAGCSGAVWPFCTPRGEELLSHILKLALGLIFVCGTVIVFSDIQPQGLSAFQWLPPATTNGYQAWLSGGAMGFVLGGVLLLLCGRPAANFIMVVLLLCGSLYIFDITPPRSGSGCVPSPAGSTPGALPFAEQRSARRAERRPSGRQSGRSMRGRPDETEDEAAGRGGRACRASGGAGLDVRCAALGP